jgi:hypothetical protein
MKYGAKFRSRIARYWSSVGVKKNVGGSVDACASCLKPVRNIHSTGAKNSRPATQAMIPMDSVPPLTRRPLRRRAACARAAARVGSLVTVVATTQTSSLNRLEMTRSANVAITIVAATTMTPAAADSPTSNARKACR